MSSINYLIKKVIRPNIIINSHHVFNFCSRNFTVCWMCNSSKHCRTNSKCSENHVEFFDDVSDIIIVNKMMSSYKNTNNNFNDSIDSDDIFDD